MKRSGEITFTQEMLDISNTTREEYFNTYLRVFLPDESGGWYARKIEETPSGRTFKYKWCEVGSKFPQLLISKLAADGWEINDWLVVK